MSNCLFKVVGKLTYSAYLIHYSIIIAFYASTNNSEVESRDGGAFLFFGIYLMSYLAALVITLLVELPTLNIEKSILFPSKPASKSEKKEEELLSSEIEDETKFNDSSNQNGYDSQKNGINYETYGFNTE